MPLVVIGASHHTVGLDELAALAPLGVPATVRLADHPAVAGVLVLATCNRFEVYLDAIEFHPAVEATLATLAELADDRGDRAVDDLQVRVGQGAVLHALTVACGLDSMVVGEAEITGQVRAAVAQHDEYLSPALRRLFQHTLATSKAVTTRTQLGAAGRSVASVGLDVVEARHGALVRRRVLLIGTGAYARIVAAELARRGAQDVWVHSPSGRAEAFAAGHAVRAVDPGGLADALARAELVVACSGGSAPVLDEALLCEARFGAQAALPVVDLSLGRDVSSAAALLPGIDLVDLETIGEHAPGEAATAILAAQDIVARAVEAYLHVEGGRGADLAVVAMRAHVMGMIEAELQLVERRYPPEVATIVGRSLRRVSNELLHAPSLRAHELARTGSIEDYRRAMTTLFGIDLDARGG